MFGFVAGVGVDDLGDQPVPDDVDAAQFGDIDVVDVVEDVHGGPQTGSRAAGQIECDLIPFPLEVDDQVLLIIDDEELPQVEQAIVFRSE